MVIGEQVPCGRTCDCKWGSKRCHEKRGYIWNYVTRKWCRDNQGGYARQSIERRECDYEAPTQLRLF